MKSCVYCVARVASGCQSKAYRVVIKMSNTLKCNSCNLVVNELLCFVQNKHEVVDSEGLVRVCSAFYTPEEVEIAKSLLFQSIPKTQTRKVKRKVKDGKRDKDLFDVIEVFKSEEPEVIPCFVALDLNRLPPITFDHIDVTRLLKDLLKLQNDVQLIKDTYVTAEQLSDMREKLLRTKSEDGLLLNKQDEHNSESASYRNKNINKKRGACLASFDYDSGPIGLPHLVLPEEEQKTVSSNAVITKVSCDQPSLSHARSEGGKPCAVSLTAGTMTQPIPDRRVEAGTEVSTRARTSIPEQSVSAAYYNTVRPTAVADTIEGLATGKDSLPARSFAEMVRAEGEWKKPKKSAEWIEVQKKRYKNKFIGKKGIATTTSDSKFKAADLKVPLFINNVDKGTLPEDIAHYISEKTEVSVTLEKIEMKQQKDYDAYKIFVPRSKIALFMQDCLWPEGIAFRRFVDFSYRNKNSKLNGAKYDKKSIY